MVLGSHRRTCNLKTSFRSNPFRGQSVPTPVHLVDTSEEAEEGEEGEEEKEENEDNELQGERRGEGRRRTGRGGRGRRRNDEDARHDDAPR